LLQSVLVFVDFAVFQQDHIIIVRGIS
jgi:hypothetical protein